MFRSQVGGDHLGAANGAVGENCAACAAGLDNDLPDLGAGLDGYAQSARLGQHGLGDRAHAAYGMSPHALLAGDISPNAWCRSP